MHSDHYPRYPALAAWHEEVAAGERSRLDFDPLWRAACCDALTRDFLAWGLPEVAAQFRHDAHCILIDAIEQERHQHRGQP
jgi:hypothetical protein